MKLTMMIPALALSAFLVGCGEKKSADSGDHGHPHKEGDAQPPEKEGDEDHDHEHEEVDLGTFKIGEMDVVAAQGHGNVEAGKEGHLVIKLPYKDDGATTVRAWIGTEDRTLSAVGKGDYAPSHDDYDIHATAPDPLPAGSKWWLEVEKPDGTKVVGSIPLLKDVAKE
jgi:hypothetical protein